jgi:hypothetical protein
MAYRIQYLFLLAAGLTEQSLFLLAAWITACPCGMIKPKHCPKRHEHFPGNFGNGEVNYSDRRKLHTVYTSTFFPEVLFSNGRSDFCLTWCLKLINNLNLRLSIINFKVLITSNVTEVYNY